jgi:hypothetical protein
MQPSQSCDSVSQITLVHDVVAVEHRSRFVAGKLRRYALGYASAHEVANRGSTKIVRDSTYELGPYHFTNVASFFVRRPVDGGQPRTTEVPDRLPVTMEYAGIYKTLR